MTARVALASLVPACQRPLLALGRWRPPLARGRLLLAVLALVLALALQPSTALGQDGQPLAAPPPTWVSLGPPGPASTSSLAVADDRQTLVALQSLSGSTEPPQVIRSRDGGATWESLPAPGRYPRLALVPSTRGPVLYAMQTVLPSESGTSAWLREILRSADLGETWETVVQIDERESADPVLVATSASDGPVLAQIGGRLFRAASPLAAWTEVTLPGDQQLQSLAPSPDYARDGLMFAALIRTEPWYWWRDPTEVVLAAHERSIGVAVSADGGLTWTPAPSQPRLDDSAYQHVRLVAVSPTFARDRTVFAHAWGPFVRSARQENQIGAPRIGALFRSRDAGATWEAVARDEPDVSGYYAQIAFSPRFADDGVALMARMNAVGTNTCVELRTADGGSTWTVFRKRTSKGGSCAQPRLLVQDGHLRALIGPYEWSQDGGQTWGDSAAPLVGSLVVVPPTGLEAGVYVGAYKGGIYASGPGVLPTGGQLPCGLQAAPRLAALLNAEPKLRAPLGCPSELERPVTFRERETVNRQREAVRGYWIEGQSESWLAVRDAPSWADSSGLGWTREDKLVQPWLAGSYAVRQGTVQRFAGGFILTYADETGGRSVLLFVERGAAYRRHIP